MWGLAGPHTTASAPHTSVLISYFPVPNLAAAIPAQRCPPSRGAGAVAVSAKYSSPKEQFNATRHAQTGHNLYSAQGKFDTRMMFDTELVNRSHNPRIAQNQVRPRAGRTLGTLQQSSQQIKTKLITIIPLRHCVV